MKTVNGVIVKTGRTTTTECKTFVVDRIDLSKCDPYLLRALRTIEPGQIIVDSSDCDGMEFILWMGEYTEDVRAKFVEYGQKTCQSGEQFGYWFDVALKG